MRILLVEDSKPIRMENESALRDAGHEVMCATDGETALQIAVENQPDLILLDLILPKMSGPEVLERLKADNATAEIPVVILSSLSEKNRHTLIAAGAEDYLEKNSMMLHPGKNLLPHLVENIVCRIHRRRGSIFPCQFLKSKQ